MELIWAAVALVVFLGLYFTLSRRSGGAQPGQWVWVAAIVGCATVALLLGALL